MNNNLKKRTRDTDLEMGRNEKIKHESGEIPKKKKSIKKV